MESFKYVIYLFACASKGIKPKEIKNIDIREIYTISMKHGIWSIVYPLIKELYKNDKTVFNLNDALFNKLDFSFMQTISKNIVKWQRLQEILNKIDAAGIEVCLLKGLTLGVLYNEPYSRSTSDIDLLVAPENEKSVSKILEAEGFDVKYRWAGSHHTKCIRNDIGLLELHTHLYDKEIQAVWFNMDEIQRFAYVDFEYDGLTCKQLNATDGLIFNFLHFVKHYICGLVTIKQLMDIMLYIKKYRARIDFNKFDNAISSLRYDGLFKAFKCLAVNYLGFLSEDLQEDDSLLRYSEDADSILKDMNKYAATDKASVYHIYTKNLLEKKKNNLPTKEVFSRSKKTVIRHMWMDEKRMRELYGTAYEKFYLKPFLQMHRIFVRVVNIKKYLTKKDVAETNELIEANERIALFEKLGVL